MEAAAAQAEFRRRLSMREGLSAEAGEDITNERIRVAAAQPLGKR